MRISTAEENAKEKIASRIPVNIATVQLSAEATTNSTGKRLEGIHAWTRPTIAEICGNG